MIQKDTHQHLIDILSKYGPLPTGRISELINEINDDHDTGYNFRWGQQQLKKYGVIDIDKSVTPNLWYMIT